MAVDMEQAYYEVGPTRAAQRDFPWRYHRTIVEVDRGVSPPLSMSGLVAELERRIDKS